MTTSEPKTRTKLPAPMYAAAGAGDLAYQGLRKLPAKVAELRERVAGNEIELRVDVERWRRAARRNALALAAATQAAQGRAAAIYGDLVSRGEHVVRGTRPPLRVKATVAAKAAPVIEPEAEADQATRPADPRG